MTNSQRLATVREHLLAWLQNRQAENPAGSTESESGGDDDQTHLTESILIVDGFYAGRTFHGSGYRATWFMEPDELKIHFDGGAVAAVFQGDAICEVRSEPVVTDADSQTENEVESPISFPMSTELIVRKPIADAESDDQSTPLKAKDDDDSNDAMTKAA